MPFWLSSFTVYHKLERDSDLKIWSIDCSDIVKLMGKYAADALRPSLQLDEHIDVHPSLVSGLNNEYLRDKYKKRA